jgi:hypothetical protein
MAAENVMVDVVRSAFQDWSTHFPREVPSTPLRTLWAHAYSPIRSTQGRSCAHSFRTWYQPGRPEKVDMTPLSNRWKRPLFVRSNDRTLMSVVVDLWKKYHASGAYNGARWSRRRPRLVLTRRPVALRKTTSSVPVGTPVSEMTCRAHTQHRILRRRLSRPSRTPNVC